MEDMVLRFGTGTPHEERRAAQIGTAGRRAQALLGLQTKPECLRKQKSNGNVIERWRIWGPLSQGAILRRQQKTRDDRVGAAADVILSRESWRRHFEGQLSVVGRIIALGGKAYS